MVTSPWSVWSIDANAHAQRREQSQARLGQGWARIVSVQQLQLQDVLKLLDLPADRALRHQQFLRRPGEALQPRDRFKGTQTIQGGQSGFHGSP